MRVTKRPVIRACAVCERTLLQGEYAVRFSPDGVEFVDVCPLCRDVALEYGWVREGSRSLRALAPGTPQATPLGAAPGRGQRRGRARVPGAGHVRRLSDSEAALVEAADLFNASTLPPHDRRRRQGARRAARLDRPALGREQRARCSRSPGRSRGTSTRSRRGTVADPARRPRLRDLRDRGRVHGLERAARRQRTRRPERRPLALPGCPSEQVVCLLGVGSIAGQLTKVRCGTGCRPGARLGRPRGRGRRPMRAPGSR